MQVTAEQARQRLLSESQVIAFQAIYARMAGSITAGLMLCQMLFLAERVPPDAGGDRWVYHSRNQWTADTTMTRWEQETARAKLVAAGFIREDTRGQNNVLHFCVNYLAVFQAKEAILAPTRRENLQPAGGKTSNRKEGKPPTTRRKNLQPSSVESIKESKELKQPYPSVPEGVRVETQLVMHECHFTDERLATVITRALEQYAQFASVEVSEAARLMIQNHGDFIKLGPYLRFRWGVRNWIREGHWINVDGWPIDQAKLDQAQHMRVGLQ
jgi:hypothetical protein